MPVQISAKIVKPTKTRFYEIDFIVTGHAHAIHNEFGRLLNESIYQAELARRCTADGLPTLREVQISLIHEAFRKLYYIDLLIESSVPVETKTNDMLVPANTAQTLNYLYLADLNHGTLLNLRPAMVQHEFVSTSLTSEVRRRYTLQEDAFVILCPEMKMARERLIQLLQDWGTHLEVAAYREALDFFLCPQMPDKSTVEIYSAGQPIGKQPALMLTPDILLSVTASRLPLKQMQTQLLRFLSHTRLRAMLWINFNGSKITLTTLTP
jgi:GxxExxY protein